MTGVMICACGCGQISSSNPRYAPRKYVEGHRPTRRIADKSVVLLSPEDEDLRARRWTLSPDGYVISSGPIHREIGARMMGRPLIGTAKGETVDHINENKLDNRRENLRVCTLAENKQNATKPLSYKKSGLPRGVYHDRYGRPGWYEVGTTRTRDGVKKMVFLGSFPSLELACEAFDRYKREQTAYVPPEERPA